MLTYNKRYKYDCLMITNRNFIAGWHTLLTVIRSSDIKGTQLRPNRGRVHKARSLQCC